ncbi:MAG: hypothetical protein H6811_03755 [Phycisphaeraceae bacterium]|nr:hypothetical protein [Phycisphaeraceae bacterium]
MSALPRHHGNPLFLTDWQPEVATLLDEHHLIAASSMPRRRLGFAASLAQFLESLRDAEVCVFYGRFIRDIESFCHQLERAIPGEPLERRIDGPRSVASLLRSRQTFPGRAPAKFRYYVWHDADTLVRADHNLFGRLVDTIAGVAAESEYVSDDALLIHRGVFIGGSVLEAYADDPRGQFQSWYLDGHGDPFWQVVTGVDRPPMQRFSIDSLDERTGLVQ